VPLTPGSSGADARVEVAAEAQQRPEPGPRQASGEAIRVLIVDDHEVIRDGLTAVLNEEADVDVVGTAGDGEAALAEIDRLAPDVILMDIAMPGAPGDEVNRR